MSYDYQKSVEKVLEWKRIVLAMREGDGEEEKVPNISVGVNSEAFELVKDLVKKYGFDGRKGLPKKKKGPYIQYRATGYRKALF